MEHRLSPTEMLSFSKKTIDKLPLTEALSVLVDSNNDAIEAVKLALFSIEKVVVKIYNH